MRARLPLLPLLLSLAGLACRESITGPRLGEGTFVLRAVAGVDLPAQVVGTIPDRRYLADTIRFEPHVLSLFSGPTLERVTKIEAPPFGTLISTDLIQYERDGNRFSFLYDCPPNADCIAQEFVSGTLTGDRLDIVLAPPLRSPLRYERLR